MAERHIVRNDVVPHLDRQVTGDPVRLEMVHAVGWVCGIC